MKLSKRLNAVSQLILQYKKGSILADIGTDHAYLPVYLSINKNIELAYACDIVEGPLKLAVATIDKYQVKNVIPLLGSGITPICDKTVDMVSICGMGGQLMSEIIDEHLDYLKDKRLFLQANTALKELREYLNIHSFSILDEAILEDGKHIYEIIVCEYQNNSQPLSTKDILFGPCLQKHQNDAFKKKWEHEIITQDRIMAQLEKSHPNYLQAGEYKKLIEEVLNEG